MSYDIWYVWRCEMTTFSASEARKLIYKLVDKVKETHEPVQIVGKRNSAILISEEDWRAVQETLYLVSIPGMRESIKAGLATPIKETDEEPGW
jgi:prevent-host-death family protein